MNRILFILLMFWVFPGANLIAQTTDTITIEHVNVIPMTAETILDN